MIKKQTKIAKTYRLLPETINDIQLIKDSFMKQRYEFSSDAAVIQYSVGVAKDLVQSVDNDQVSINLNKDELRFILEWARYHGTLFDTKNQELELIDKIKYAFETI